MSTTLRTPLKIGTMELPNRLYRAPVLEGVGSAKSPEKIYAKHFVPNAKSGLGLIIQGNTIVLPEGRTSPGMSAISEREQMLAFRPMTEEVRKAGCRIVVQLGHGGCYALESWHKTFMEARHQAPLAPSTLPWWLRMIHSGVHVMTTEEVQALIARFGKVALWAREAGYDGVQLAGSNAKLLHQFISPIFNRRKDQYGGHLENRFRILGDIRQAIAKEAGEDYPVLLKYTAQEDSPFGKGIRLEEGIAIGKMAEESGFSAVTPVIANALPNTVICRGGFPKHSFINKNLRDKMQKAAGNHFRFYAIALGMWSAARKYGFSAVWNRPIFTEVKKALSIPVFAVGGIRSPQECHDILSQEEADVVGVGRPFYAEADLAARFLQYDPTSEEPMEVACENCNRCIVPQMLGMPGVCYNPSSNMRKKEIQAAEST